MKQLSTGDSQQTTVNYFKPIIGLFMILLSVTLIYSCVSDNLSSSEINQDEILTLTEVEDLFYETLKQNPSPKSTSTFENAKLSPEQQEIIAKNQLRTTSCDPGIDASDPGVSTGTVFQHPISNAWFSGTITFNFAFYPNNGGVSIYDITYNLNPGFWADNFILIDNPNNSPNYGPIFNLYRGFMFAFIISEAEDLVVTQPGVIDHTAPFIFLFIDSNLEYECLNTGGGSCPTNTKCCKRWAIYYKDTGIPFGRYLDANGNAAIQGGTGLYVCPGTGNNCGSANAQCNNSSMGYNSLQ